MIDPTGEPPQVEHLSIPTAFQSNSQPSSQLPPQYPGPAQPAGSPPPAPAYPPPGIPSNTSQPSPMTLALLNQTAMQKGCSVTYPADSAGQPHQPTWTVRCCSKSTTLYFHWIGKLNRNLVNGEEYGRGVGRSQKLAKEEAARQAWANLGW